MQQPAHEPPARHLIVNGQQMALETETLSGLLMQLSLPGTAIVAELNGHIVPMDAFSRTWLGDGDVIELVRFVGGG